MTRFTGFWRRTPSFAVTILNQQGVILQYLETIMAEMDDLKAKVARTVSVQQSAVIALQGLKARLDSAGTDPAQLAQLSADLGANTDALAAAIVANTPAADPTAAAPATPAAS